MVGKKLYSTIFHFQFLNFPFYTIKTCQMRRTSLKSHRNDDFHLVKYYTPPQTETAAHLCNINNNMATRSDKLLAQCLPVFLHERYSGGGKIPSKSQN